MSESRPGTSRRNLIKAGGAAGLIWSAPMIRPVTAHAAGGTCSREQYDFGVGFVPPTSTDDDITLIACPSACLPGGQVYASTCTCTGGWAGAATTVTNGTVAPPNPVGANVYTAPAGCNIVDIVAVVQDLNASGGCLSVQCRTVGSGISLSSGLTQATLASPGTFIYRRIRVLLCCPP